ncbi:hypothetical protein [Sulfurirhabdus autotrophica]|uniref:Uncharacterized protein n=1 Tax=Sulfurirhabdus autotrophica TaxID=1706046 RepID=A0A4R3XRH0_9PROT|nr:hypothetical protein [Sulfurirhabdus autotrophica]TCV79275.1 hypothetical protein EDC63_1335 [Sulfurirhabdus autotrophica]
MDTITSMTSTLEPLVDFDQVVPYTDKDHPLFNELYEVLKRHGALRRFGITLLHQHFPITDEEILLEKTNIEDRIMMIRPTQKTELKGKKYLETSWRLDTGTPVMVCVCVPKSNGGHDHF